MTKNNILYFYKFFYSLCFLFIFQIFLFYGNIGFANEIDDCEDFFREYYEDTDTIKDEGCLKDGEFDGVYKSYYPDGSIWESLMYDEGKFLDQDGKPYNGEYTTAYRNGILAYKVNLKEGFIEGMAFEYYENGQIKNESQNKSDLQHGKTTDYFEDGQIESIEHYKNGELNGSYKEFYGDGTLKIESVYRKGELNGEYKTYHENGQLSKKSVVKSGKYIGTYQTFYRNGKKEYVYDYIDDDEKCNKKRYFMSGQLEMEKGCKENYSQKGGIKRYFVTGSVAEEWIFENQKHMIYYPNGNKFIVMKFLSGYEEASSKIYHDDGTLAAKVRMRDEKIVDESGNPIDGDVKWKYRNGSLWQMYHLKKGRLQGNYKTFYRTGQVFSETFFKRGRPSGMHRSYYQNGQTETEFFILNGLRDGIVKEYYENGKLELKYKIKDLSKNGKVSWFNEDGSVFLEGNFVDDLPDGIWTYYDQNGAIIGTENFKAGLYLGEDGEVYNGPFEMMYEDDILAGEINYEEGLRHGLSKLYYSTGELWVKFKCVKGDCKTQDFYKDGTLKQEGSDFMNDVYGITKNYYPSGKLKSEFHRSHNEYGYEIRYDNEGQLILYGVSSPTLDGSYF